MRYRLLDGKAGNNISIFGMDDDGPELAGDIRQVRRGEQAFRKQRAAAISTTI
jgi:hypothetical protein